MCQWPAAVQSVSRNPCSQEKHCSDTSGVQKTPKRGRKHRQRPERESKNCRIDQFTLLSASWVIRARWEEIQRFAWKFKTMKSIHDMEFFIIFFIFPKQKICAQKCGRRKVERMAILEISSCHTFPVIPKAQNYRE